MKNALTKLTLVVGAVAISASGIKAGESACDFCVTSIPKTYPRPKKVKVCTKEIDRCTQEKVAKGPCGRTYVYTVTCITYKDIYSDGTERIWTTNI